MATTGGSGPAGGRDFPEWHEGKWHEVYWKENGNDRVFEPLRQDGYLAVLNQYHLKTEDITKECLEPTPPPQLKELSDQKTQERLRFLAYELWNQRGRPSGDDLTDWLDAQRRLGMI